VSPARSAIAAIVAAYALALLRTPLEDPERASFAAIFLTRPVETPLVKGAAALRPASRVGRCSDSSEGTVSTISSRSLKSAAFVKSSGLDLRSRESSLRKPRRSIRWRPLAWTGGTPTAGAARQSGRANVDQPRANRWSAPDSHAV
jgi:hypothetical protein